MLFVLRYDYLYSCNTRVLIAPISTCGSISCLGHQGPLYEFRVTLNPSLLSSMQLLQMQQALNANYKYGC